MSIIVLTEKAKRFCLEYVGGEYRGNQTQSYLRAYPGSCLSTAQQHSVKLMKKPHVLAEINRLKDKAKISEDWVLAKLKEGAEANLNTTYRGQIRSSLIPDYSTRHQYVTSAAKILKMFPTAKHDHRTLNIDIQLEKLPPAEISALLKGMMKKDVYPKRKARVSKASQEVPGRGNLELGVGNAPMGEEKNNS